MKKIIILFFLIVFAAPVFAQNAQPWWLSLEQGKLKFRSGDYGGALLLFEDARRDRRAKYEQMERDFINFLSLREVRPIGDSLEFVERFSYERQYTAASSALEELYYRIPKSSFKNSAKAALEAFDKLKDYPEAEYWIGEVYRVEGELSLALAQYRKVYALRDTLEDTGFAVSLQYKIAGILMTRQEYNEMEKLYLSIISDFDTLWANAAGAETTRAAQAAAAQAAASQNSTNGGSPQPLPYAQSSASFASQSMTRTLENEGIGRFMELYRYNNRSVEQAHRRLGFYYAVQGRAAQQHLMFAFLIQNTIIIEEIMRRQFDFRLNDPDARRENGIQELLAVAQEINRNPLLLSYVDEVEYYKTIYYLASALYRNGKSAVARNFWNFLASQPQAGEWHNRALVQIRNPRLEPVVEMP